jgi:signal transduction histidine kinase/CheY-like chemotaxis protein/HPt (histidine-containing phosphotransfer) domain-containing protein
MPLIRSYLQKIFTAHLPFVQVLFVFLAFGLMVFLSYFYLNNIEQNHHKNDTQNLLAIGQSEIEAEMKEFEMTIYSLSQSVHYIIMHGGSIEDVKQHIKESTEYVFSHSGFISGFTGAFGYFDVFGGLNIHSRDMPVPEGFVAQSRPWYTAAVEASGNAAISQPYISINSNNPVIAFASQILDYNGNQLGVIGFEISLDRIKNYAVSAHITESGYGVLVNNKEIIAHPQNEYIGRNIMELPGGTEIAKFMEQELDFFEYRIISYTGRESSIVFKKLGNGWYIGIITPHAQYYTNMWNTLIVLIVLGFFMAMLLSMALVRLITDRNRVKEQMQIMLDATPLGMNFWNREFKDINTNEEAVKLFGVSSKKEYCDRIFELSPEYQDDGRLSIEKAKELIQKAFDEGYCRFEWTHCKLNGELIPCEITLVRVQYQDDYIVAGYTRDLREMTKLTAEKESAEQSSRNKNAFLANLSHEIRTPMNVILGIAEIQLQNENISREIREAFNNIYNSGFLLLKIVNDILDLSKIEAGKLELMPVNYNIASLIDDTVYMFVMRYDNKPVSFLVNVDENIPSTLLGDDLRIKQILNNLLSNAFKYTDRGEITLSVTVASREEPDDRENQITLVFRVQDTGQGMASEQLDKLFDEYTRFNLKANRSIDGAGLGMPITKYLVSMMNGEIFVESEPGKGSLFTVHLPQKIIDNKIIGREISENLKKFHLGKSSNEIKSSQIEREYMPYGRILIVDDVETNLYVARGLMALYGMSIETVNNGYDAIERIKEGCVYDIVFMDHFMPSLDGMEAAKIIREMGYDQPIIALTANAMIGQAEIFIANGFNGFISKPIDIRQLNTLLNKFVRDKQPAKVLETARQLKASLKKYSAGNKRQTEFDKKLTEIFALEAEKAAAILENFIYNNSRSEDDFKTYIIKVHSMKSALANINEPELSGFAYELEKSGNERNIEFIIEKTPAFLEALKSLIVKYKPAEKDDAPPDGNEISAEDKIFLQEKLLEIKMACASFNVKNARTALEELNQKDWPRPVKNNLDEISMHLLHSALRLTSIIAENTANMYKN